MAAEQKSEESDRRAAAHARDAAILIGERGVELKTLADWTRFAEWAISSGLAPKDSTVASLVIAMECGANVGMKPLQSIQRIVVTNGRPQIDGKGMRAVLLSHPLFEGIEECWLDDGDNEIAEHKMVFGKQYTRVCRLKRRGVAEWHEGTFSVADAKQAKQWNAKKNGWEPLWEKHTYQSYWKDMLTWRALSRAANKGFADAMSGIYIKEDLLDSILEGVDFHGTEERVRREPRSKSGGKHEPAPVDVPLPSHEPAEHETQTPLPPTGETQPPGDALFADKPKGLPSHAR